MSGLVGKVARIRSTGGVIEGIGMVSAFVDQPCYVVDMPDGRRMCWKYCLTEEANLTEQIEYWRARAIAAESR